MKERLKNRNLSLWAQHIFWLVFTLLFTVITAGAVFSNASSSRRLILWLSMLLAAAIILIFYRLTEKRQTLAARLYPWIMAGGLLTLFVLQIVFAALLRFEPAFDLEAIYQTAIHWVETGEIYGYVSSTCDADYFYYFPNNLGSMAFLAGVFKLVSFFGVRDYFMTAAVVNAMMLTLTVFLSSWICKRLWGVQQALALLLFVLISPPFYFAAAVFYTDFLSILFPVLVFALFLKRMEAANRLHCFLLSIAAALAATVGMLLKFTVVIIVIAIVIYLICTKKLWPALELGGLTVLLFFIVNLGFQFYLYHNQLDREKAEQYHTPYSHWVMMGLKGSGGYNGEDYEFTRSFANTEERDQAIAGEIRNRLKQMGISGFIDLAATKWNRLFSDGTYALSDFLDDNPLRQRKLHRWLLYDGEAYADYHSLCGGVFYFLLGLMVLSAMPALFGKAKNICFVPQLSVFGITLFLTMWEVNSRYIVNFIPMILIAASGGLSYFAALWKRLCRKLRKGESGY